MAKMRCPLVIGDEGFWLKWYSYDRCLGKVDLLMASIVSGGFSLKFPVYNGHFNSSIYKMEIFCLHRNNFFSIEI